MKEDFTLENFKKTLGITQNNLLAGIVKDIFGVINSKKRDVKDIVEKYPKFYNDPIDVFEEYCYDSDSLELVKKLLKDNRKVYVGSFADQGWDNPIELYLCFSKILISNEDIYLESLREYY
jgi:hypothetical protein